MPALYVSERERERKWESDVYGSLNLATFLQNEDVASPKWSKFDISIPFRFLYCSFQNQKLFKSILKLLPLV